MTLPKITHPVFEFTVPSTQKKQHFRPFLVKEVLLMAKASEDPAYIFRSIKQIINNCALDRGFDIDKLTIFDMEYLFLQLRAVSVNNVVKVSYRDNEDQNVYDFDVDIKNIDVVFPKDVDKKIPVSDTLGIVMRYPPASIFNEKQFFTSTEDSFFELMLMCMDLIYDGEEVHNAQDYSKAELEQFLDNIGIEPFEKMQKFLENSPKLSYTIKYKNSLGNDREIEMSSLTDFFTLG
jgi:hypothetical protein